jgi:hypothetical protein
MIFNGHTQDNIDALDEATMNEIIVMYADGAIGNYGLLQTLGSLTAGVFNYLRAPNSTAYELKSILGNTYSYMYSEQTADPNESLLTFMTQAQGFSMGKFKKE